MRTERPLDVESYVASARRLELMALDLAERNVGATAATRALIEAANGDVRVMRRAHRHCERAPFEQWPTDVGLIRAFDFLSAGRQQLEVERSRIAGGLPQPSIWSGEPDAGIWSKKVAYDIVDEPSMESFPASDAPSFWARDPQPDRRRAHGG